MIGNALRVALGIIQGNITLDFGRTERLRAFRSTIFTRRVAMVNCICSAASFGSAALRSALLFAFTASPVKKWFRATWRAFPIIFYAKSPPGIAARRALVYSLLCLGLGLCLSLGFRLCCGGSSGSGGLHHGLRGIGVILQREEDDVLGALLGTHAAALALVIVDAGHAVHHVDSVELTGASVMRSRILATRSFS